MPLIVAGMATIVSVIVFIRKRFINKELATTDMKLVDKPKSLMFPALFLVFICTFSVFWIGANLINYALDFSTPVLKTYTVIEKKQRGGGKALKNYDLILNDESEELTMSVDIYTYKNYEIGEKITISIYQGALDVAYYVYD